MDNMKTKELKKGLLVIGIFSIIFSVPALISEFFPSLLFLKDGASYYLFLVGLTLIIWSIRIKN